MTGADTIRLSALATHVPDGRISVPDCVRAAGASPGEAMAFCRLFGVETVAAAIADDPLPFAAILDDLSARHDGPAPDLMIYVHGNPALPATAATEIDRLADSHPLLARVTQRAEMDQHNCSTLFWAMDAAQAALASGRAQAVVILAGDSLAESPQSDRYAPGCTAIGDAFAGLILDARPGGLRVGDTHSEIRSEYYAGRFGPADAVAAFNGAHSALVADVLNGIGQGPEAEPILAHNINSIAWRKFCAETGTDPARIDTGLLPDIGHCYTLDAILLLDRMIRRGGAPGSAALLSVGQGGFLAGCRISIGEGTPHATA